MKRMERLIISQKQAMKIKFDLTAKEAESIKFWLLDGSRSTTYKKWFRD